MNEQERPSGLRRIGLITGPLVASLMLLAGPPAELGTAGWGAAAVAVLMVIWWVTEAVPLAATALIPLIAFPLLGVQTVQATASSYAHPLIFLFLGGFILARAMARWSLHRRLAILIVRAAGSGPMSLIGGLMLATAILSMWVSNTATAMVMLPIGQSLIAERAARQAGQDGASPAQVAHFGAALMLGIAYAATIGGIGSLIGTPANALFAGLMETRYATTITFAEWMLIGLPVVLVLLPLTWIILTRIAFPIADRHDAPETQTLEPPGPMSREEKAVAAIMVAVALGWILHPRLQAYLPGVQLSDAGIAIFGALLMFAVPVRWKRLRFLLTWADLRDLRWDVLILFGGGLALAAALDSTGLAAWISGLLVFLETLPTWLMVLAVMAVIVFLGELASNTAMAAMFLPVAAATAVGLGDPPLSLALPVALAASLGFMLPVATPPNAIVYGSGAVSARQMLRAGAYINVVSILVVATIAATLGPMVFGY